MTKRLLDYDDFTGVTSYFSKDSMGNSIIEEVQDVEPLIEVNKYEGDQLDKSKNWWKVGTIPNVICLQWEKECGHSMYTKEWMEFAKKKLNDRDWSKFNVNRIKL